MFSFKLQFFFKYNFCFEPRTSAVSIWINGTEEIRVWKFKRIRKHIQRIGSNFFQLNDKIKTTRFLFVLFFNYPTLFPAIENNKQMYSPVFFCFITKTKTSEEKSKLTQAPALSSTSVQPKNILTQISALLATLEKQTKT